MTYAKKSRKKTYIALILVIVLLIAATAATWVVLSTPKPITVGVKAGDTFTYQIVGSVIMFDPEGSPSEGFERYNQTDYFKVEITDVQGTNVSTHSVWRFLNGTEIKYDETFDITTGGPDLAFWAIYPSNLQIGDLLRPNGYDGTTVNNTYAKSYANSTRETDFWFINNQFQDTHDQTGATLMYDYRNIDFDQATGVLVSLENFQAFNNPERNEQIVWKLIESNVWDV
jgi:hypothetical protein